MYGYVHSVKAKNRMKISENIGQCITDDEDGFIRFTKAIVRFIPRDVKKGACILSKELFSL